MKPIHCVSSILFALVLVGCSTKKSDNLEGVWKFVSGKYTWQDTTITLEANENLKAFKIFGNTRYANLTQDTTKQLFVAHSGTYLLEGNEYTENIEINKDIQRIGSSAKFKYQIDGNQFRISNDKINETWQKIE